MMNRAKETTAMTKGMARKFPEEEEEGGKCQMFHGSKNMEDLKSDERKPQIRDPKLENVPLTSAISDFGSEVFVRPISKFLDVESMASNCPVCNPLSPRIIG